MSTTTVELRPPSLLTDDTDSMVCMRTGGTAHPGAKDDQKMPTHGIEPWILSYQTQIRVFTSDTPYHLAKRARAARN